MQRIVTQEGPAESDQAKQARAALLAILADLDQAMDPTTGMVLKLVDGSIGWFPARRQLPVLPYVAPVAPASGGLITTLGLLLTEHNRLVASHNELIAALLAQGYMLPKPTV